MKLLAEFDHFGMSPDQITVVPQDKVPALCDNDATFAKKNPWTVSTKPHGHGDVR
jgi:UDP-N-acetylglucosamine pyrophosphorylase